MSGKKIMVYLIVGVLLSTSFFGGIIYFMFLRNTETVSKSVKTYEYVVGDFTSNLGTVRNFFKGKIVVEITDKKLIEKFPENDSRIRDSVIKTLIDKKPDDIMDPKGQQNLRDELIKEISTVMETDRITNLYFTDYIIQ